MSCCLGSGSQKCLHLAWKASAGLPQVAYGRHDRGGSLSIYVSPHNIGQWLSDTVQLHAMPLQRGCNLGMLCVPRKLLVLKPIVSVQRALRHACLGSTASISTGLQSLRTCTMQMMQCE